MIKLKSLLESHGKELPAPELKDWILKKRTVQITDWLYHGSPLVGLKGMIMEGIYGVEHGEVAEYESFSTSLNPNMMGMFSEHDGDTGLCFKCNNINVVILDDILHHLVTRLPGSGMDVDVNEEELAKFVETFKIPSEESWVNEPYLPYNYLSSLGVDAFTFDYVWKRYQSGNYGHHNDESEICFIGNGIAKLNGMVESIYVDGKEYPIAQKADALADIESRL